MASDEPPSLRTALEEAESRRQAVEAASATSPGYAEQVSSVLALYDSILEQVGSLSLFSPNETIDDMATSSMPYLGLHFASAELVQRTPFTTPSRRKLTLRAARDSYERFLALTDGYGLISAQNASLLERYRDSADTFSLASPRLDAAGKRQAKMDHHKADKDLHDKLAALRRDPAYIERDEELVRAAHLADAAHKIHKTFQALDSLNREMEMLAMAPPEETDRAASSAGDGRRGTSQEPHDVTLRLDSPLSNKFNAWGRGGAAPGPLLSQQGKPLQPFTLVGSRQDLAKGVFRPGHNLPTMSIDEYLAEEKRRGGILEGGTDPPKPLHDDDDMDAVDRETYKARQWDDYKDDNRRGAGNTLNMG